MLEANAIALAPKDGASAPMRRPHQVDIPARNASRDRVSDIRGPYFAFPSPRVERRDVRVDARPSDAMRRPCCEARILYPMRFSLNLHLLPRRTRR